MKKPLTSIKHVYCRRNGFIRSLAESWAGAGTKKKKFRPWLNFSNPPPTVTPWILNMTIWHCTQASEQEMGCGRTVIESLDWRQRIERTFKKWIGSVNGTGWCQSILLRWAAIHEAWLPCTNIFVLSRRVTVCTVHYYLYIPYPYLSPN